MSSDCDTGCKSQKILIIIIMCLIVAMLFLTYSIGKIDGRNSIINTSPTSELSVKEKDNLIIYLTEQNKLQDNLIICLTEQNKLQDKIIRDCFRLLGMDPNH